MEGNRRVLVIGLDAVETPVLLDLMQQGRLPVLSALASRGVSTSVDATCMSTLPGAIWQDILTGIDVGIHGNYYPSRIVTGQATTTAIDPACHVGSYYTDLAAAAGRRVISIDHPLVPPYETSGEHTLVAEWHLHDNMNGRGTCPTELLADLEQRFGTPAWDRCDTNHGDDDADLATFTGELIAAMRTKIDMAEHLMTSRPWDLFSIAISEGHCAGHQMWHVPDNIAAVYEAIDAAVGRLIAAAGPDTSVVVFTSHGMNDTIGGPQLLPTLLPAWGYGDPRAIPSSIRRYIPIRTAQRLFKRIPAISRAVAAAGVWNLTFKPGTLALAVHNNRVGAIRLNIEGREPDGVVAAADVDGVLTDLETRFGSLRLAGTDEPIVARLHRTADLYGPGHHPDLPDLLVVFRRDLGELDAVDCPTAGRIAVPARQPDYPRSGDHTEHSRLWLCDPEVRDLPDMASTDIAPLVLERLGVAARHADRS